jgi:spore photoproduct lyase
MQSYQREFDTFKRAQATVASHCAHFGHNKKHQITRLLYEIAKRDNHSPEAILQDKNLDNFAEVKTYLIKQRFPYASTHGELSGPYLPPLKLDASLCMRPAPSSTFYPKTIFVENAVRQSHLAGRFKGRFPEATVKEIPSLAMYLKERASRSKIQEYNRRRDAIFITGEHYDFFKKCPCTKGAVGCGYHIFNLSFGCIFDCTYCYLQEYTNNPGIIFPANLNKFFDTFNAYKKTGMRIGTGEFSDSLMLDDITEYSVALLEFFKKHRDVTFEFKTKSSNIKNLLKASHNGTIVVSWSLNPQAIINTNEFFTTTLRERVNAARHCGQAGYKVGFHFDPLIYCKEWQKHYEAAIELLFNGVKPKDMAWISLGTLRFNPQLKKIIEVRFPNNMILDEELLPGNDGKLRYPYSIRYNIYKTIKRMLSKHAKGLPIYLCMEEKRMWRDIGLQSPFSKQ